MKRISFFSWSLMLAVLVSGLVVTGCESDDEEKEFILVGKSYGGDMGNNVYRKWTFISNTKYVEDVNWDNYDLSPEYGTYELVLKNNGEPSHVILTGDKDKDIWIGYFVSQDKFYIEYSFKEYFYLIK